MMLLLPIILLMAELSRTTIEATQAVVAEIESPEFAFWWWAWDRHGDGADRVITPAIVDEVIGRYALELALERLCP